MARQQIFAATGTASIDVAAISSTFPASSSSSRQIGVSGKTEHSRSRWWRVRVLVRTVLRTHARPSPRHTQAHPGTPRQVRQTGRHGSVDLLQGCDRGRPATRQAAAGRSRRVFNCRHAGGRDQDRLVPILSPGFTNGVRRRWWLLSSCDRRHPRLEMRIGDALVATRVLEIVSTWMPYLLSLLMIRGLHGEAQDRQSASTRRDHLVR